MNIWIIYDSTEPNLQILSEKLADFLDKKFNVNVANSRKIKSSIILDEDPEILIFGISLYEGDSSLDNIKNWITNLNIKSKTTPIKISQVFNFGIGKGNIVEKEHSWQGFLLNYYKPHQITRKLFLLKDKEFNGIFTHEQEKAIVDYSKYIINKIHKIK
ncbi:MAG: hypothetical protein EU547_02860 [Promethearchaeota archaeon]|nr:MAG: hypothetical protein EU547_02860 [Candidatus Lokiarchaeota archaeon]